MPRRPSPAWITWHYVLLIALWLILRALFFDRFWWLAIVNTIAEYLFVPLPMLLVLALWRRSWRPILGLAIPALAWVVLFGGLFLPARATVQRDGPIITAMTFNVLTSNRDADAIVGSIRAAGPEVIGMQELTRGKKAALKDALETDYPYHTFASPDAFGAIGLMSRFPIQQVVAVDLPSQQPALHAILLVEGRRLHIFVAHLSPNNLFKYPAAEFATIAAERYASRAAEVARLREAFLALDEPAILLCDCNLTDTSEAYVRLSAFLRDSFHEAGWGFGHTLYSNGLPFATQRIDYVWHSDALAVVAAKVGDAGASDHLPVVAMLRLVK